MESGIEPADPDADFHPRAGADPERGTFLLELLPELGELPLDRRDLGA